MTAVLATPVTTTRRPLPPGWAPARVNDHVTGVLQAHYPDPSVPVAATVTVTATLTFDDVVAVFYRLISDPNDDLADLNYARELIAEGVLNEGLCELDTIKSTIDKVRPGTDAHRWLAYCQRRAADLFPGAAPATAQHALGPNPCRALRARIEADQ